MPRFQKKEAAPAPSVNDDQTVPTAANVKRKSKARASKGGAAESPPRLPYGDPGGAAAAAAAADAGSKKKKSSAKRLSWGKRKSGDGADAAAAAKKGGAGGDEPPVDVHDTLMDAGETDGTQGERTDVLLLLFLLLLLLVMVLVEEEVFGVDVFANAAVVVVVVVVSDVWQQVLRTLFPTKLCCAAADAAAAVNMSCCVFMSCCLCFLPSSDIPEEYRDAQGNFKMMPVPRHLGSLTRRKPPLVAVVGVSWLHSQMVEFFFVCTMFSA